MFNFTTSLKKATVLSFIVLGGMTAANAANVYYNGIKYTSKGTVLTVAKSDATSGAYAGDIVIESPITVDGVEYTVGGVAATAFKNNADITSIVLPTGCTDIKAGAFQNCTALKSATLPSDLTTFNRLVFSGCSSLEAISIPGGVVKLDNGQLGGCTSLKKIVLEESDTEIAFNLAAFGTQESLGEVPVEEVEIYRPVSAELPANAPFRGEKTLAKVTLGGKLTSLSASYFENCTALTAVEIPSTVTELGTSVFRNTGITSVNIPGSIVSIPETSFAACKSLATVTLNEGTTSIRANAFNGSAITSIALPASLQTIGVSAFSGCQLQGDIVLPAAVTSVADGAFVGNAGITSFAFPASLTSLGEGVFNNCSSIANFTVDAANTAYKVKENNALATLDGKTILAYPVANANTSVVDPEATTLGTYAFNGAKNLTEITVDNCTTFGNYSLANTGILSAKLRGTVGRYVLQGCTSLKEVELTVDKTKKEIPHGVVSGCTSLEKFTISEDILNLKQEAFANCTSLKEINLGGLLCIIEADAFTGCGVETITVGSALPAAMTEGVFTEANSNITAKVPNDYVNAYKEAAGWKYLNIEGDANITAKGTEIGMPKGLYYAGKDGILYSITKNGVTTSYDVGGIPHTFQLTVFKDRIYGTSAGVKFTYDPDGNATTGDGKLFYISQIDGNTFQATVLDNTGSDAYKDPMGLYIYGDTLYINDRNVCVRKVSADAIALPTSYQSWLENTWLGYYGSPWAYGCIKSGFAITQDQDAAGNPEPLYWLSMRYNGNGIFRFKESDIDPKSTGTAMTAVKPTRPASEILSGINLNASAFYVDEANNHFYIYIVSASNVNAGLYRVNLDALLTDANADGAADATDFASLNPILVDGAPVLLEGPVGSQETGITQLALSHNGDYLYWCYISDLGQEGKAVGTPAETYNAENPLHQTGIKRVKLGEETPAVEMVIPGVEAYGIVDVDYENSYSSGVESVAAAVATPNRIHVIGDAVTVMEDAVVAIYNAAGALVAKTAVTGVKSVSLRDQSAGLYVVEAAFADGSKEVVKVAK